jgi:hypothetical protein
LSGGTNVAVEGKLTDMSLPNLIQTICLEQRTATLVVRRRRMEEGVITFDGGEIVHATTGSLTGEEALFHLLGWNEGSFRQRDHVAVSRRTIAAPWKSLLLEGVKRIDHGELGDTMLAQVSRELSPAEIEQDSILENALISLLSRLENLRAQVAHKKCQKRPATALQLMARMMNHAATFSEDLDAEGYKDCLVEALTAVGEWYPAARLLRAQDNRLQMQSVSRLYGNWSNDSAGRRQVFHQMGRAMLDILETFFMRFTASFHSLTAAKRWRETCRVFLTDLAQAVDRIEF